MLLSSTIYRDNHANIGITFTAALRPHPSNLFLYTLPGTSLCHLDFHARETDTLRWFQVLFPFQHVVCLFWIWLKQLLIICVAKSGKIFFSAVLLELRTHGGTIFSDTHLPYSLPIFMFFFFLLVPWMFGILLEDIFAIILVKVYKKFLYDSPLMLNNFRNVVQL